MIFFELLMQQMRQHADPIQAKPMAAYMRNQFSFLGIPAPKRRLLLKQFSATHDLSLLSEADFLALIDSLWNQAEREFQYIAIDMLETRKSQFQPSAIKFIEHLIIQKPWWDTVDLIASHFAGSYFRKYPDQIPMIIEQWISSSNIWLQRSALIFQLSYKQHTDVDLLFRLINRCEGSKQFFINKAIGWALREYAKTNRSIVEQFVSSASLHPLSKREALKQRRKS